MIAKSNFPLLLAIIKNDPMHDIERKKFSNIAQGHLFSEVAKQTIEKAKFPCLKK